MPWSEDNYPQSMKNLKKAIRSKAIEIANALKDKGYSDQRAISIATEKAEQWYKDHHVTSDSPSPFKKGKKHSHR